MTDTHKDAREALARIVAIEGVTDGPWQYDPGDALIVHRHNDTNYYVCDVATPDFGTLTPTGYYIAACDPATMRAIAALVDAQEAKIAALRGALGLTADQAIRAEIPDGYRDHVAPEMPDDWHKGFDAAIEGARVALTNTAATAAAHDARIRAEAQEAQIAALETERAKDFERGLQAGEDYKPVADAHAQENEGLRNNNRKLKARIAALREALTTSIEAFDDFQRYVDNGGIKPVFHARRLAVQQALADTAATAAAHDARIRAEAKAEYEGVLSEAEFLLNRIKEWEADGLDGAGYFGWRGHVEPSIARLTTALRTMGCDDG